MKYRPPHDFDDHYEDPNVGHYYDDNAENFDFYEPDYGNEHVANTFSNHRHHYAMGGISHMPATILNAARRAAMYTRQGARYLGNAAYGAGRSIYNGAQAAGRNAYNMLPTMRRAPMQQPVPRGRMEETLGNFGRSAGAAAAGFAGRHVARAAGAVLGPHIGAAAARVAMPMAPRFVANAIGGGLGGLAAVPLAGYAGSQLGQWGGGHAGEALGRATGRGMDYLGDNAGQLMNRAGAVAAPYVEPMARAAAPIARQVGSAASAFNQYTPASLAVSAMAPHMQEMPRVSQARGIGMPGFEVARPRSSTTDSFRSMRSPSPSPYEMVSPWPRIESPD